MRFLRTMTSRSVQRQGLFRAAFPTDAHSEKNLIEKKTDFGGLIMAEFIEVIGTSSAF